MNVYLAINSFRSIMWPDELLYAFQKLNDPIKVSSLHENESAIDMMQFEFSGKMCCEMTVAYEM